MRNDQGISIILTDSDDEAKHLIKQLGVGEAFPLTMLPKLCSTHPDAVYYEILDTEAELKCLAQHFVIRRGVISVNGKRSFLGFNADWMGKVLVTRDLERAIEASLPKALPVSTARPTPVLVVCNDDDRDDPYESLGYSRSR